MLVEDVLSVFVVVGLIIMVISWGSEANSGTIIAHTLNKVFEL